MWGVHCYLFGCSFKSSAADSIGIESFWITSYTSSYTSHHIHHIIYITCHSLTLHSAWFCRWLSHSWAGTWACLLRLDGWTGFFSPKERGNNCRTAGCCRWWRWSWMPCQQDMAAALLYLMWCMWCICDASRKVHIDCGVQTWTSHDIAMAGVFLWSQVEEHIPSWLD